jgi:hypothetical protein
MERKMFAATDHTVALPIKEALRGCTAANASGGERGEMTEDGGSGSQLNAIQKTFALREWPERHRRERERLENAHMHAHVHESKQERKQESKQEYTSTQVYIYGF